MAEERIDREQAEQTQQPRRVRRADRYQDVEETPKTEDTRVISPVQPADSRVPAPARRMSADPYGAVRPVSAAAVRRPSDGQGTKKRPEMTPRPDGQEDHSIPSRQKVGYAPGRMSESLLRQHREEAREDVRTDSRESIGKTGGKIRVQEYPENRFEKPAAQEYLDRGREKRNIRRIITIIAAAVLVIGGAAAVALAVLPEDSTIRQSLTGVIRLFGKHEEEPLKAQSFTVSGNEDAMAPTDVTFSVVTAKDVENIRLTDEKGRPLETTLAQANNTEDSVWVLTLHLDEGYTGTVRLQAMRKGGEWLNTGDEAAISVKALSNGDEGNFQPAAYTLPPARETAVPAETTEPEEPEEPEETPEDEGNDTNTIAEEEEEVTPRVTPNPTEIATMTPTPEPTPAPTATPPLEAGEPDSAADPSLISTSAVYIGGTKQKEYNRAAKELIHMPVADEYSKKPMGVLTFRGDNFRRNAACGTVDEARALKVVWTAETGSSRGASQTYYGVGWTGQAAIVKWSKEVREKSNIYEEKREVSGLKEVIVAGLDGAIRFLDLSDGKLTRNSTKLGYPMRGTPSVHPGGFPYMNVGQFARKMKVKTGKIGLRQYNLYSQKEITLIDGLDGKLHRAFNKLGSFETSALIDRTSDTVITAGTNGMLYLIALNSDFDYQAGVYKTAASTVVLRTRTKAEKADALTAVESSVAAYDKYVYYADMGGVLRCVDTNTLKAVWAVNTGDAVKAAVALDMDGQELNLYTANMLENRKSGNVEIRRYDAMTGHEDWCSEIGVAKGKKETNDVGAKASPVIGQNDLSDLVFFTVTGLSAEGAAELGVGNSAKAALIALDKDSGRKVWALGLEDRSESSPVAVYSEQGKGWIIQCDHSGKIILAEGRTGKVVNTLKLDGEIDASPAVYNDMMVISTTGKSDTYVYGIRILGEESDEELSAPTQAEDQPGSTKEEASDGKETPEDEESGEAEEYPEEEWPGEESEDEEPGEDAEGIG